MAADRATFGARVEAARAALGLSRIDLALRAEVFPEYLLKVERGRCGPAPAVVFAIASALGVDPGDLTRGLGPLYLRERPTRGHLARVFAGQ